MESLVQGRFGGKKDKTGAFSVDEPSKELQYGKGSKTFPAAQLTYNDNLDIVYAILEEKLSYAQAASRFRVKPALVQRLMSKCRKAPSFLADYKALEGAKQAKIEAIGTCLGDCIRQKVFIKSTKLVTDMVNQ